MAYPSFQPAQPNALRILNRKYSESERRKWSILKSSLPPTLQGDRSSASGWDLAHKFSKRTTIHGVDRLLGESVGRCERYIWTLALLMALMSAIYVCLILSRRFNAGQFQTVVDSTRKPVYHVHFPVVTICNQNRLNWQRLPEAQQRFLPQGAKSNEQLHQLFARIMATYDDISFANFDRFAELEEQPLELLNAINFSEVMNFMTWRCDEMLTDCVWNHLPMDCCDIFLKRRTKHGLCWAFNSIESDEGRKRKKADPLYPWHTGGYGQGNGLLARVLINSEKHYPNNTNEKGISLMIAEPNVWHSQHHKVPANTRTLVDIEPVIFYYENDTRSISSEKRGCVFDDERGSHNFKSLQGYIYMNENCHSECDQEYLMRYCNCTVDLLFPPGQYPVCKITDMLCLAKYNEMFLYTYTPGEEQYVRNPHGGMVCRCLRNCFSLNYVLDVRPTFLPPKSVHNSSFIDLDVHYRFESMMVYRTSLVFGWVDLIVAFGGIAGLFLGCSLISAMELAYFALIEMPSFVIITLRSHWRRRNSQRNNMEKFGMANRIQAQNHPDGHELKSPPTSQQPVMQYKRNSTLNRFLSPSTIKAKYQNEI